MIVSASYRTDIPAFHAAWFRNRLEAGFCEVVNPYSGRSHRVDLTPGAVEGFVFWTRNAAPFREALRAVEGRGTPFVLQYTITGYPRALEPSVPAWEQAVAQVRDLAARHGPRAVVWRYDPVFITSLTPAAWHEARFAALAAALEGACDEAVLSFAQIYAKTKANSDRAARRAGFTWRDPEAAEKSALLGRLAETAQAHGMTPSLCSQPDLLDGALSAARCIDPARLSAVGGRTIAAPTKGNRPGCLCAESRDIGAYDTCPHGCVYCYAVRRPERAKVNHRAHDPRAAALSPPSPSRQAPVAKPRP